MTHSVMFAPVLAGKTKKCAKRGGILAFFGKRVLRFESEVPICVNPSRGGQRRGL
jgi:hypothetical protein